MSIEKAKRNNFKPTNSGENFEHELIKKDFIKRLSNLKTAFKVHIGYVLDKIRTFFEENPDEEI